jgi:hypothetical protein
MTQHGRGIGQQFPARRPAEPERLFRGLRPYRWIRVLQSPGHRRAETEGSRRRHRQKALVRAACRESGDPFPRIRLLTQQIQKNLDPFRVRQRVERFGKHQRIVPYPIYRPQPYLIRSRPEVLRTARLRFVPLPLKANIE